VITKAGQIPHQSERQSRYPDPCPGVLGSGRSEKVPDGFRQAMESCRMCLIEGTRSGVAQIPLHRLRR
jgi:hypothetical protein